MAEGTQGIEGDLPGVALHQLYAEKQTLDLPT
jgi:hypothetical protein